MRTWIGAAALAAVPLVAVAVVPVIGLVGAIPLGTALAAVVWTLVWWLPGRASGGRREKSPSPLTGAVAATSLAATAAHSSAGDAAAGIAAFAETVALLVLVLLTVRYAPLRPAMAAAVAGVVATGACLLRLFVPSSIPEAVSMCLFAGLPAVTAAGLGGYLRAMDLRRVRAVTEARRAQRVALARDLHDFVAHEVTGMVVRAQAALVVADRDPGEARAALERVAEIGTRALDSIDRAVALLRAADSGSEDGPGPGAGPTETEDEGRIFGLADLPGLAEHFGAYGPVTVELHVAPGSDEGVSPAVGATAYRVVSEALTNVRRHAPTAERVEVFLASGPDSTLIVTVTDAGPDRVARRAGAVPARRGGLGGWGLMGLAQRVEAHGGSLHAGPLHGGGWRVSAVLPAGTR
jgi:signal transduction histidine kinase